MFQEELFGSPDKTALARRSAALWSLLQNDPRFAYYGRLVALSEPGPDAADVLTAMAKLQGAAVSYFYPANSANQLFERLERQGLATDRHEHFWGGDNAILASRKALQALAMPSDLRIEVLGKDTPADLVREVANLCEACDVMPVRGSIMRGLERTGICLVAIDPQSRAVATASSYCIHHSSSRYAKDVFWGMLATHPERRGEKISLLLGAKAIVHMWEQHGARGFMTGVREDNPSSKALCQRLGVGKTEWIYASCIDKEIHAGTTVTK